MRRLMTFDRPIPGSDVLAWVEELNARPGRSEQFYLTTHPTSVLYGPDGAHGCTTYRVHLRDADEAVIRPGVAYRSLLVFSAKDQERFVTTTSLAMQALGKRAKDQSPPNRHRTTVA